MSLKLESNNAKLYSKRNLISLIMKKQQNVLSQDLIISLDKPFKSKDSQMNKMLLLPKNLGFACLVM
jgi:hypothetical protein